MIEIWCEDENAGADLLREMVKHYFSEYKIDVISIKGISKSAECIEREHIREQTDQNRENTSIIFVYDSIIENPIVLGHIENASNLINKYLSISNRIIWVPIRCFEAEILSVRDISIFMDDIELKAYNKLVLPLLNVMQNNELERYTEITKSIDVYSNMYNKIRREKIKKNPEMSLADVERLVNFEKLAKEILNDVFRDYKHIDKRLSRCFIDDCCKYKVVKSNCMAYRANLTAGEKVCTIISKSGYRACTDIIGRLLKLDETIHDNSFMYTTLCVHAHIVNGMINQIG